MGAKIAIISFFNFKNFEQKILLLGLQFIEISVKMPKISRKGSPLHDLNCEMYRDSKQPSIRK